MTLAELDMSQSGSELATGFQDSPTKSINPGYSYAAIAKELSLAIKLFSQLFTWPADQPRHATITSTYPVESNSPPYFKSYTSLSSKSNAAFAKSTSFSFRTKRRRYPVESNTPLNTKRLYITFDRIKRGSSQNQTSFCQNDTSLSAKSNIVIESSKQ